MPDRYFLNGFADRSFSGSRAEFIQLVAPDFQANVNAELDKCLKDDPCCDIEFEAISSGQEPAGCAFRKTDHLPGTPADHRTAAEHYRAQTGRAGFVRGATVFEAIQEGILILDASGRW